MKLGYIGLDQCGNSYRIKQHPRKELLEQLGSRHAERMFIDGEDGEPKHIGYVIGQRWITVYEVHEWAGRTT